jgi:hypothetical protein
VLAAPDITTQSALLGVAAAGGRLAAATLRPGRPASRPRAAGEERDVVGMRGDRDVVGMDTDRLRLAGCELPSSSRPPFFCFLFRGRRTAFRSVPGARLQALYDKSLATSPNDYHLTNAIPARVERVIAR